MAIPGSNNLIRPFVLAVLLAVVFAAGYLFRSIVAEKTTQHAHIRLDGYRFISPLLECEVEAQSSTKSHPDLRPFKEIVQHVVDEHLADKSARTISVYFRDLKNASWFGIRENEMFPPASLMKVPLMIAILKRAELDSALLQKKIRYQNGEDRFRHQHFRPKETLQRGSWYTVDDLVFRMIAYSDNDSSKLLADHFGMATVDKAMAELDIPIDTGGSSDYISLRNYTAFFRILYNASYLSHAMSEKALGYLARSTFEEGIRAGLPKGTLVAGKFGEYSWDPYHLNECGIVYYPDHPYLLGIATMGGTPASLTHVIQEISKAVYLELDRQHQTANAGPRRG